MPFNFKKSTGFLLLMTTLFVTSCKEDVVDVDPISSRFGEYVDIPNHIPSSHVAYNFLATDNGLYFGMSTIDDDKGEESVYRYTLVQSDILKGKWISYKHYSYFDYFMPLNKKSELHGNQEVMIYPSDTPGKIPVFKIVNMLSGKVIQEIEAPWHQFLAPDGGKYRNYGEIIKDGKGAEWALFQSDYMTDDKNVHIIKRKVGNSYDQVSRIVAKGELLYAAANNEGLYAISPTDKKLFVINPESGHTTYDLSEYYDAQWDLYSYKIKFRFSNNATFFQYQNKVLKLNEGNKTLSLFYTIKAVYGGVQAGDFCVDNDYLFTTDGTRKELNGFHKEVNIIPPPPKTTNQEIFMEHMDRTTVFQAGELETSTNPDDKYIYVLDGVKGRILVVSKHYI